MNYLFFDIECANCFNNRGKICEFGYVLTDDKFNEIKKDNIIINPNAKFDKYVIKNMLTYSKEEYNSQKFFPNNYKAIKDIITSEQEIMIFGHSIDSDARYLNDECKRYALPYINYKFYDVIHIYKGYSNEKDLLGLKKIAIELGVKEQDNEHRAMDDAVTTKDILSTLCCKLDKDVFTLIDMFEDCKGETKRGRIKTVYLEKAKLRRQKKYEEKLKKKQQLKNKVATEG